MFESYGVIVQVPLGKDKPNIQFNNYLKTKLRYYDIITTIICAFFS